MDCITYYFQVASGGYLLYVVRSLRILIVNLFTLYREPINFSLPPTWSSMHAIVFITCLNLRLNCGFSGLCGLPGQQSCFFKLRSWILWVIADRPVYYWILIKDVHYAKQARIRINMYFSRSPKLHRALFSRSPLSELFTQRFALAWSFQMPGI